MEPVTKERLIVSYASIWKLILCNSAVRMVRWVFPPKAITKLSSFMDMELEDCFREILI